MITRPLNKTLQDSLSDLFEELKLAGYSDRPSINLAVCESKLVKSQVENALTTALKEIGQSYVSIQYDPIITDLPGHLSRSYPLSNTVFSVSGLGHGGGVGNADGYRSVNLFRETWVEHGIRAIFWLTPAEAAALPRNAPDFWAFRHRVFLFDKERGRKLDSLPSGHFLWESQALNLSIDELDANIQYQEKLLFQLPIAAEALSMRISIQLILIHLFWLKGDFMNAVKVNQSGLEMLEEYGRAEQNASLLNCRGILDNETQGPQSALAGFEQCVKAENSNGIFLCNLGVVNFALGRPYDANLWFKKAIKADPENALVWNIWGFITMGTGKYDAAKKAFEKAIEISPNEDEYMYALAACYFKMGDLRKVEEVTNQVDGFATRQNLIQSACMDVMRGEALLGQSKLLQAGKSDILTRLKIARSPLVHILFDFAE